MSDNAIKIELDGKTVEASKGEMLIQVADRNGVHIPRFCYHEKLSVAANCRMCLVEQVGGRKPMPACATPVMDGMKFNTRSPYAIKAQKATMEFLLINHPLDCPICDQGGECELQDVAIGYGGDESRYTERKRVVKDKNLGPLVSTDMTRCIHCTRCVRFGEEVAGIQELGTIGRGEFTEIGTYIENSVDHELSGNIIDLCPVGALNSKPFRFQARGWEMTQHETVAPHDSLGTNLFAHVRRGKALRVVPRSNEAINETWASDRDRFSYSGIYSEQRLQTPMLKRNGEWQEVDWSSALEFAAERIKDIVAEESDQLVTLASPRSTVEELYLLNRLTRGLGSNNIDHRLLRQDFSDQHADPLAMTLGTSIADLEQQNVIFVVGSNVRAEAPLLAHRLRKASLNGAKVMFANPEAYFYYFDVYAQINEIDLVNQVAGVVSALQKLTGKELVELEGVSPNAEQEKIAKALIDAENAHVFIGSLGLSHANFASLRRLTALAAQLSSSSFGYLAPAANSVGAELAGALPHRDVGGRPISNAGLNVLETSEESRKAYLLFGIEPESDVQRPYKLRKALEDADVVVAVTAYVTEAMKKDADVLLPLSSYAETAGTYVNCEGKWQSVNGFASPVGDSRPGWKILRVLGNLFDLGGFEFASAPEVYEALKIELGEIELSTKFTANSKINLAPEASHSYLDMPIYATDPLVRRATPLQNSRAAKEAGNLFFKQAIV
ncbi:MAG: NADH-quinone oxidoreductase subunit G [Gammaproteobacteria bacterium]|nr:NADH-quinone oxidoreductase subunit NuoG [Gammaproteobacteria bacterium]NNC97037.1 NADH-quinone oxidoreductase subunit G [Gammaproteobacteria bacterium]NNM13857.1 NADH-quinone oxidoreductase subunit G [Gammaproteobacteria bacterium]